MMDAQLSRRRLLEGAVLGAACLPATATATIGGSRATAPKPAIPVRLPLRSPAFTPLPLGSVRPAGWLERQLRLQAESLGGRLDETWADVGPNSGWLGGTGESWERGPYWLDGLVPLAWQLDSAPLKTKAQRFIDWTLANRQPNGMFGPASNDDWWPRMVMLKVLTQYHEATGDERVIALMKAYFAHQLRELPARPLRDWGRFRWQDQLVSVLWLYNRTGDRSLLRLAALLKKQGFDWQGMFADMPFKKKITLADVGLDERGLGDQAGTLRDPALSAHGVNNAQGIKASPLWAMVSGSAADLDAVHGHLAALDRYHGMPNGMFSADEHLAGRSPSQGVELCAVVETLYSLEVALAVTGDPAIADRIERIAYNALPATFSDDMWAHQYDQQPNQVECSLHRRPWTTNGPESNLYGLEPHFGCCTANFHQGWPKLTSHLWMASVDGGIAAMLYAPSRLTTSVAGHTVSLVQTTEYPFRDSVIIDVETEGSVEFPLHLRIPGWSLRTGITVNGERQLQQTSAGSFVVLRRSWRSGDRVAIQFEATPKLEPGVDGAQSISRGALVFALPIAESWVKWRDRGLTADWQVYPASAWNYALVAGAPILSETGPIAARPFARSSPVSLKVQARLAPTWKAEEGAADPPPPPERLAGLGRAETITLVPYGVAKLRVTAFPTAADA